MDSDPLHYFVINDSSINAFAGPGATFFINTGIIELAETEGELASVITHELAHYKQKTFVPFVQRLQSYTITDSSCNSLQEL